MQGASQKSYMSPDGFAAGQAGDGLIHYRLEDGGRQILLGGALVDQGLDISLGKHAAACGDGVQGLVIFGVLIQTRRVRLDQGGHLVDKGACTTGADAVHALLHIAAFKIDDLGVLAAQLNGHIGLGSQLFQGGGHGDDLLGKRHTQVTRQGKSSGAGDHRVQHSVAQFVISFLQQGGQRLPNIGIVPLIVGEKNFVVLI